MIYLYFGLIYKRGKREGREVLGAALSYISGTGYTQVSARYQLGCYLAEVHVVNAECERRSVKCVPSATGVGLFRGYEGIMAELEEELKQAASQKICMVIFIARLVLGAI